MKKMKSNLVTNLLLIILCLSVIVSCNEDNTVTPPNEPYRFDSARFNYQVTRLDGILYFTGELWSVDTNEVFMVNPFQGIFVHLKDNKIHYYSDPDFNPTTISGISNNEVYLFGLQHDGDRVIPGMKKWNGIYLENLPINLTFNKPTFINKSIVRSSSEMWLFCNNIIIRKEHNIFSTYELEDTTSSIKLAYSDNQSIPTYCQVYFNTSIDSLQTIKVYQFSNNSWEKIYDAREDRSFVYDSFNRNKFCKRDLNNVYLFDNNNFTQFFSNNVLEIRAIGGVAEKNFMVFSFNTEFQIFNWNGQKWSQEFNNYNGLGNVVHPINKDLYYFYAENEGANYTNLIRAFRPK